MNNEDLKKELIEQRAIIDSIYVSVEKTRKYFMWSLIITVAFIVLPLIAMVFVIPFAISSYSSVLNLGI